MDRKEFLKKGIIGTTIFTSGTHLLGSTKNEIDELSPLHEEALSPYIGFNHLPNSNDPIMKNSVYHKASSRGTADHGWLRSQHSFSFANYYNPDRMHFGVLRVLNDDIVAPSRGFGTHPHDNMEIISIPLSGDLRHKDSMGNEVIIKQGDIQVMSAGTGITHSEYNKNNDAEVQFLQIWLFPNKKNVAPRYDQLTLQPADRLNNLQQVLSPSQDDAGVWIHQDAWFHMGSFGKGFTTDYQINKSGNGVYAFVIRGSFNIGDQVLGRRDGFGLWDTTSLTIESIEDGSEILVMEVPMIIG